MRYAFTTIAIFTIFGISSFFVEGWENYPERPQAFSQTPVRVGTGSVSTTENGAGPSGHVREFTVVQADVTAYSPVEICGGRIDKNCITANGSYPQEHHTVACPRSIPLGTHISILDEELVCEDRMAFKFDERYDIFIKDWKKAKEFGIKKKQEIIIYE